MPVPRRPVLVLLLLLAAAQLAWGSARGRAAPLGAPLPQILIDASRDGGVWWFPQTAPFDAAAPHQGLALAQALRARGFAVTELPRDTVITPALFQGVDLVVRAGAYGTYTSAELAAYAQYVDSGGRLLLLGLLSTPQELRADTLPGVFGLVSGPLGGGAGGNLPVTTFAPGPLTVGVDPFLYLPGSGIAAAPSDASLDAWLSSDAFLDSNGNGLLDAGEPLAPAVVAHLLYGAGRVVYCGSLLTLEQVPQPLTDNLLDWLVGLTT
jgi:hypothetical protein